MYGSASWAHLWATAGGTLLPLVSVVRHEKPLMSSPVQLQSLKQLLLKQSFVYAHLFSAGAICQTCSGNRDVMEVAGVLTATRSS